MCMFNRSLFVLFLLTIVLFVPLRFTDSDYLPLVSSKSSFDGLAVWNYNTNAVIKLLYFFFSFIHSNLIYKWKLCWIGQFWRWTTNCVTQIVCDLVLIRNHKLLSFLKCTIVFLPLCILELKQFMEAIICCEF
jgi:hypothetical protein